MLTVSKEQKSVKAVLRVAMIFEGEAREKGEVVDMKANLFTYLVSHNRVAEATKDNVAEVAAEVKAEAEVAAKNAKRVDELESTKSQLATALAKIAALESKK